MQPLRILVAQAQADILAESIARVLSSTHDLALLHGKPVSIARLNEILSSDEAVVDVVIVIGNGLDRITDSVLDKHPQLVLSYIAIGPDLVDIKLRNIGLDQLIAALRALARDRDAAPVNRTLNYRLVMDQFAADPSGGEVVPVRSSEGRISDRVVEWLDETLLRYHRGRPADRDNVPGLTRSAASVESLLACTKAAAGDSTHFMEAGEERCDQELFDALDAADASAEPLAALHQTLGLSRLEMGAFLLALAPEIDPKYQSVYGYLHDDLGRRAASLGLICGLLGDPPDVRSQLGGAGGLGRWRLLEQGTLLPYAEEMTRVDATIVNWLLGDTAGLQSHAERLGITREVPWPGGGWLRQSGDLSARERLVDLLTNPDSSAAWCALAGEDSDGWCALVEAAAAKAHVHLMRISLSVLASVEPSQLNDVVIVLARSARLLQRVSIVDAIDAKGSERELRALALLHDALGHAGSARLIIARNIERFAGVLSLGIGALLHRAAPEPAVLGASVVQAASEAGINLGQADAERLVRSLPVKFAIVQDALQLAKADGVPRQEPAQQIISLSARVRRVSAPNLPQFARRIEPNFRLDAVILSADRRAQLDEMVAHVKHASKVLGQWGFSSGRALSRGLIALFCGPTGTGKSMTAEAIARELHTEAYLIDLAQVVSKYIGESEKNLEVVFTEAERAGALLVFNEADVLFSKRSEVKQSQDRYANMEIAYLLQRMESFSGLAILTTNFRQNLDEAFLRRIRFIVEFAKPDEAAREAIWRQCLPSSAPLAPDVDLRFLASRLELTGGSISLITLRAAFNAAQTGSEAIGLQHIITATRAELLKVGMAGAERELAAFEAARRNQAAQAA